MDENYPSKWVNSGWTSTIDKPEYIDSLATPHGPLPYDQIFDKALDHVVEGWHLIAAGVYEGASAYRTAFWNWNLDTGRDGNNRLVLWS